MRKEYFPYYISRAILSLVFAFLVLGIHWKAVLFAIILFGLFLLYLHSGWFSINLDTPLTPLRRDQRGQAIQRKALIAAVIAGTLLYLIYPLATGIAVTGSIVLSIAIITYFATQFVLFIRA